ncbi:DUF1768-domain-containing protein [Mycena vulgaris]|nr:DUF1768-domain-containing protein [Mycena vulgaris]
MNYSNAPQAQLCTNCHTSPEKWPWDAANNRFFEYWSRSSATEVFGRTKRNTASAGHCNYCYAFPKRWNDKGHAFYPYCSKTCGEKAERTKPVSAPDNCDYCHSRPKRWDDASRTFHQYCGTTCRDQARLARNSNSSSAISAPGDCDHCHSRPKRWDDSSRTFHPYCGRTCRGLALGWTNHSRPQVRVRILFYERNDPHYGFTNFSPHPVVYNGKVYPTSEHLFQAFKFMDNRPDLAEKIRNVSDSEHPRKAFELAGKYTADKHPDWFKMNIAKMDIVIWHKFTQHEDLKQELLGTGDAELVEDSAKDPFWGIGRDKRGQNQLGKALERLRSKLRGGM